MKTNEKELEPPKAAVVTLPGDLEAWILCDVSALYETEKYRAAVAAALA